jgi:hypothetical protein
LDVLIELGLLREHLEMSKLAKANKKKLTRTVISGAGPNGLYSAFKFFLSGMDILLVNDRPEE